MPEGKDNARPERAADPATAARRRQEGRAPNRRTFTTAQIDYTKTLTDQEELEQLGERMHLHKGQIRALIAGKSVAIWPAGKRQTAVVLRYKPPRTFSENVEVPEGGYLFLVLASVESCPSIAAVEPCYKLIGVTVEATLEAVPENQWSYLWKQCFASLQRSLATNWFPDAVKRAEAQGVIPDDQEKRG